MGEKGLILTVEGREISLAQAGAIRGTGHFTLIDCRVSGAEIPYADFSVMRYSDGQNLPSVAKAVADFQLALLGQLFQEGIRSAQFIEQRSILAKLDEIASNFAELLDVESREEELQRFIRDNPLIIHVSASLVPKQKLGEDFITDFVLIAPLEQGPRYYLVEIERASLPLFTKDGSFSSQVNHAIKQTRDWDIWLEEHQAYLRGRLDGFESPQYMIIIGRGTTLSPREKAYLRSHNRDWKNTTLLTYDDLLTQFKATISRLREASLD